MKSFFRATLLVATIFCLHSCGGVSKEYQRNSGLVFGTNYNITYEASEDYGAEILDRLRAYDASVSSFNKKSLLSSLNAGMSVRADSDLLCVLRAADHFHNLSGGVFDVTVEPLSRLWRFAGGSLGDTISVATYDSLALKADSVRAFVGMEKIVISGDSVFKTDSRVTVNASALAEGRGIDIAAEVLEAHGVVNYMVELGGEIHCKGLSPRGDKWAVGVERPVETVNGALERKLLHVVRISDCALSTSGNYRQCYHVADGRTVQHSINPKTGRPVEHRMLSVTVVAPCTMMSDALSTTLMVMGPDSAIAFASKIPQCEALIVFNNADGEVREEMTDGFAGLIK